MLSIDYIRENKQKVVDAAKNKNREVDVDKILELDEERKSSIHKIRNLEKNVTPNQIKNHTKLLSQKERQ